MIILQFQAEQLHSKITHSPKHIRHLCGCISMSSSVGRWAVEQLKENKIPGDQGLVLKSRAKYHAIAAMLDKPFIFKDDPLVVQ